MTMEETIRRINELAHKAKQEPLTPEELTEQKELRTRYVAAIRKNLTAQLDNTYIIEPDGTKHKLGHQ